MTVLLKGKERGGLALLAALLAFSMIWSRKPSAQNHTDVPKIQLFAASYQTDASPSETAPLPPSKIEVDTRRKRSTNIEILRETLAEHQRMLPPSAILGVGKADSDMESDWFVWARLGSAQADTAVRQTASLPANAILAYSAISSEGSAVVMVNRAARRVPVSTRIRLPRGVYKIERLTFAPKVEGPMTASLRADDDESTSFRGVTETKLERLQGRELASTGTIEKPVVLEPGAVCILRFTEQVQEVAQTYRETNLSLNRLGATNASAARRIRRMLQEGGLSVASLHAGGRNSTGKRLSRIHRMLLVTAQAQSRQKNDLARRAVPAESGTQLRNALDRLTDSLSETSAVILGLVPRIAFERKPAVTTAGLQETPEAPSPTSVVVTVALTNAGAQSVKLVKLGIDATKLPQGVACDPTEPALFGTLKPGQTARAAFRLRGPSATSFPMSCCVGDVSYFVPDAPAHLRPRSL